MAKFLSYLFCLGFVIVSDASQNKTRAVLGQVIHLPRKGCAGGCSGENVFVKVPVSVTILGIPPYYDLQASFCRHVGDEKWESDKACFCMVNKQDERGNTLLHDAVEKGKEALIDHLFELGACYSIRNKMGKTPFDITQELSYRYENIEEAVRSCIAKKQKRLLIPNKQYYHPNYFHILVTAEKLDNDVLVKNNRVYCAINGRDGDGCTPLHVLVMRPDATIEQVQALLLRGADPELRTNIYKDAVGNLVKGHDVYRCGLKYLGMSPIELTIEENQYVGNKEVMRYIFWEILLRKLKVVLPKEEARRKRQEEKRAYQKQIQDMLAIGNMSLEKLECQQNIWEKVSFWREEDSGSFAADVKIN